MADPLYNATCRLQRGTSAAAGTNALTRTHSSEESIEARCSLRQLSVEAAQAILGAHQVEAWRLRLVAATTVPNGSMVEVKLDGDGQEYAEYRVQTVASRNKVRSLLVTRA